MSGYIMRGAAHIGIMTSDPDKCAAFYVDNLDFHYHYEVALGDKKIVFVENYGLVLEFVGGSKDDIGAGQVDHICLEVQGIEALVEELKKKGVEFENDGKVSEMPNFFINGAKNVFFKGPAGERVELFDYT